MFSGINMLCFSASYVIVLALEVTGLWTQAWIRRAALLTMASAGVVAHTWYLARRVVEVPTAPLASYQDWCVLAAWMLAVIYLTVKFYYRRSAIGLFLLPAVLGLIGASRFASDIPLATFEAPRFWGRVHGILLMLGTVTVLIGFVAGLMYLVQSYKLKHKLASNNGLKLPSLEWLERTNSLSLGAATLFVAGGFFTGVVSRLASASNQNFVPWTDPVVLSLGSMMLWLLIAEVFRLVYPAARSGRKVAYLTIAGFVFLLLVLATMTMSDSLHTPSAGDSL